MTFTNRQKADCAKREVKQRIRVYPRWVSEQRMSPNFASEQIALMEEIAEEYEAMDVKIATIDGKLARAERRLKRKGTPDGS
jgi:hypothetical protein